MFVFQNRQIRKYMFHYIFLIWRFWNTNMFQNRQKNNYSEAYMIYFLICYFPYLAALEHRTRSRSQGLAPFVLIFGNPYFREIPGNSRFSGIPGFIFSRTQGLAPFVLIFGNPYFREIPIFGKSREFPIFGNPGKFFPIFGNPGIYFGRDSRSRDLKLRSGLTSLNSLS